MADSCVEGHRKRAKYLLGEAELGPSPFSYGSQLLLILLLELLKRQKTCAAKNTSSPAQTQAPAPKTPSDTRNSVISPSFVVSPLCCIQLLASPQRCLYSIYPLMHHLFPLDLRPQTSNIPSFQQSWVALLRKATPPRIPTHQLHHHQHPPIPFLPLHQSTPPPGPVAITIAL